MRAAIRGVAIGLACTGWALAAGATRPVNSPQQDRFDVNDVSYLWPVATSQADVDALISASDPLADGTSLLWPRAVFDTVIKTAPAVGVESSAGMTNRIDFGPTAEALGDARTWKVVALRIDPCAPGCDPRLSAEFGAVPQIRLVLQPVTVEGGAVQVHDVAAHLVFAYVTGVESGRFIPDAAAFREIVNELKQLKAASAAAGAPTAGALRVHPGLQKRVPGFAESIRAFLRRRVSEPRLMAVAFVGLAPRPEPWIFYAMDRHDGTFERAGHPAIPGDGAQMLTLRGGTPVMPAPSPSNVAPGKGVSTNVLFPDARGVDRLDTPVFAGEARPLHRDIPDIIANPALAHFRNTDCVSCHTESTRRSTLGIRAGGGPFKYSRPPGMSGVDEGHLPQHVWNVRNFGWFRQSATVTERTANEAAESADAINRLYLAAADPLVR